MENRRNEIINEIRAGMTGLDGESATIWRTRREVIEGWRAVASNLRATGEHALADGIRIFTGGMSPPETKRVWLARQLLEPTRGRSRIPVPRTNTNVHDLSASREHNR
jgi:hypothetical protein